MTAFDGAPMFLNHHIEVDQNDTEARNALVANLLANDPNLTNEEVVARLERWKASEGCTWTITAEDVEALRR